MIRIAVCDDENVIVNQIEHIISEVCKRESIPVNIDVFYSGRELKRQVTSGTKYDIIFLDIQMKGGDGITAAENIRKVDDNVLLIYVSGYDKYMMELFRLDVFGFIKKPIDEEILTKTWVGIIEHPDDPFCICTVDGGRKKKGESGTGKILFFSPVGASGKHSHCNQ